ncbi:protein FAM83F-like [Osmerus mordax]|uniref:protein FAM83F-like n=1 Tax=Osmerus mordax TaxID=8014 RepID=UPI0035109074
MAESQIMCMEDGQISANVSEDIPAFYYSEIQRAAVEELLKNGDGAFKTRLKDDKAVDFLSAREIKTLREMFKAYEMATVETSEAEEKAKAKAEAEAKAEAKPESSNTNDAKADSGVHSTYWPQLSDTEVPPLDIGWPNSGFFRGVTRVTVHTHPPKDNGPHIKEVVRRLIQEANKVVAIVMDLLTDIQILQDILDAASKRSVSVYILLDGRGVPHFLDMCSRLQLKQQHLQSLRVRSLQGTGFGLSFGKLPGSMCCKYMLVDGDKVMFGSYSFSWASSRMDRNMITVMSGQAVDVFDRDFRELYAVSDPLDLYREFHIRPGPGAATLARARAETKRPPLPATTSRFQVSLGDSRMADLKVPAHKYHNPKYALVFGDMPGQKTLSLADLPGFGEVTGAGSSLGGGGGAEAAEGSGGQLDRLSPLPSDDRKVGGSKKSFSSLRGRLFRGRASSKNSVEGSGESDVENSFEVVVKTPGKGRSKKLSKQGAKSVSLQTVNSTHNSDGVDNRP